MPLGVTKLLQEYEDIVREQFAALSLCQSQEQVSAQNTFVLASEASWAYQHNYTG